jgi:hypothetical protein
MVGSVDWEILGEVESGNWGEKGVKEKNEERVC